MPVNGRNGGNFHCFFGDFLTFTASKALSLVFGGNGY